MRIPLNRQSNTPIYLQIENFLKESILNHSLEAGTRLPATRQLAQTLGVNRNTVENAYAGLEADGLVEKRVGSGTYVLSPYPAPLDSDDDQNLNWPTWQRQMQVAERMRMPVVDPYAGQDDLIRFDQGGGDADQFPVDEFRKVLQHVLRRDGIEALGYGDRRGYPPLRETIAHVLASQGLLTHADHVLVTAGSQQAIALVAQTLLDPGDTILVEQPTYAGGLDLFRTLKLRIVGVPVDQDGMQVDQMEAIIQRERPKLIYTIPNFHNPTGTCLSGQRRRKLISLIEQYNLPLLEDDFVGDLRYEGRAQPTLKALDPGGRLIYTSTFSKMLTPGLRVGFLVAEGPVYKRLSQVKNVYDIATSSFIQRALNSFVTVGRYQAHLRRAVRTYRQRRDQMVAAIRESFPAGTTFYTPQGGLFLWVRLPDGIHSDALSDAAHARAVTLSPGSRFFLNQADGANFIRLNFVTQTRAEICEGIARLGASLWGFP